MLDADPVTQSNTCGTGLTDGLGVRDDVADDDAVGEGVAVAEDDAEGERVAVAEGDAEGDPGGVGVGCDDDAAGLVEEVGVRVAEAVGSE